MPSKDGTVKFNSFMWKKGMPSGRSVLFSRLWGFGVSITPAIRGLRARFVMEDHGFLFAVANAVVERIGHEWHLCPGKRQ